MVLDGSKTLAEQGTDTTILEVPYLDKYADLTSFCQLPKCGAVIEVKSSERQETPTFVVGEVPPPVVRSLWLWGFGQI